MWEIACTNWRKNILRAAAFLMYTLSADNKMFNEGSIKQNMSLVSVQGFKLLGHKEELKGVEKKELRLFSFIYLGGI